MKRLDDLGVSPAPWTYNAEEPAVYGGDGSYIADCDLHFHYDHQRDAANARLAAAPSLYKALHKAVINRCSECEWCSGGGCKCWFPDDECEVQQWRKALEKAGGRE